MHPIHREVIQHFKLNGNVRHFHLLSCQPAPFKKTRRTIVTGFNPLFGIMKIETRHIEILRLSQYCLGNTLLRINHS